MSFLYFMLYFIVQHCHVPYFIYIFAKTISNNTKIEALAALMDICRWDFSNATEYVSFRWIIITMIYTATIILTICSDSIDDKLYFHNNLNLTLTQQEMISNRILSVSSSFSVTRSIGAICGWIMIGLTPHEDLLYAHLLDLTKYQMPHN